MHIIKNTAHRTYRHGHPHVRIGLYTSIHVHTYTTCLYLCDDEFICIPHGLYRWGRRLIYLVSASALLWPSLSLSVVCCILRVADLRWLARGGSSMESQWWTNDRRQRFFLWGIETTQAPKPNDLSVFEVDSSVWLSSFTTVSRIFVDRTVQYAQIEQWALHTRVSQYIWVGLVTVNYATHQQTFS